MSPLGAQRSRSMNVGGQNPEFVLREFEGMNNLAAREAINDHEFWWCENAIPVAPGNLLPVNGPSAALVTIAGETGAPSYTTAFNSAGVDYSFVVWMNSGNGWIVNLASFVATKIITGLTSGKTTAIQYGNYGLLILDPTGYWDWNITTPATLTPQNNAAAATTETYATAFTGGISVKQVVGTIGGTGGVFQTFYTVTSAVLNAAGTGYAVGDTLTLTDNNPVAPAAIVVTSIGAGGAITGATLILGGSYPGPTSTSLVATGPTGTVLGGGSAGTGATFTILIKAMACTIVKSGTGYGNTDTITDETSFPRPVDSFVITSSGVIGGVAIAAYAGRVWIATGRVVLFTDINSYTAFGGAGGTFTINDTYLHNGVTALFSANNYLYIFGDSSIDVLSNVTISNGVTAFSRVNITASLGTSEATSVFSYYRAIAFHHASGFYLLSGATPEKISERISGLVQQISLAVPAVPPTIYGCSVLVDGELCLTFSFTFTDIFTLNGIQRSLMALYFRGRWCVISFPTIGGFQGVFSVSSPLGFKQFFWAVNKLYRSFSPTAALSAWLLKTKLWDGGTALHEKQAINAAIASVFAGLAGSGITVQVDTELGSSAAYTVPAIGSPSGYQLLPLTSPEGNAQGGSQYLGLTISGGANATRVALLALRGKTDRNLLQ